LHERHVTLELHERHVTLELHERHVECSIVKYEIGLSEYNLISMFSPVQAWKEGC